MTVSIAEQILGVVKEGFDLWKTFISTRQEAYNRKQDKKLKYRLEASENYVFVDEKSGIYKDISDSRREKLKVHFRKRIFDSN